MENMQIIFVLLAAVSTVSMARMPKSWQIYNPPNYVRTPLGDSIDLSTMKILKEAYNESTSKNIVVSPLGLMILLSLYNLGAGPQTNAEINNFLGGTDAKQISKSFEELSVKFSEMDPDYLTVANKMAVSTSYTFDEKFTAAARGYRSEFDRLDFSNKKEAADAINKWSAEKTKGHITNPVTPDSFSRDMAAALFNVIYFNGHWHVPFRTKYTKEKDFHVSHDRVVNKTMMHLMKSLYYTECTELDARMIELPYKEQGFRMVVVLPNEIDGLPSVLEKLTVKGLLSDVFNLWPTGRNVDLDMPKFDIRTKVSFNEILRKVGVSQIFSEPVNGIVQNVPLKVSSAFQEAFIKINEEGATAGAFTGFMKFPTSAKSVSPIPIKFTVDHPFMYAILHEDKILFAGTYSE